MCLNEKSGVLSYLSQDGPKAPKHSTWTHPILCVITHYVIATLLVFFGHDYCLPYLVTSMDEYTYRTELKDEMDMKIVKHKQRCIGMFFLGYWFCLILYRFMNFAHDRILQIAVLYEATFLCNMTLYMTGIVLSFYNDGGNNKELIIMAHIVTVSIDQVLWYVDLTGWVVSRGRIFPIGVAKYLTWPQTSITTRISSTHHLWTIPLAMYACRPESRTDVTAYFFSAFVIVVNVLLSRWMTPLSIEYHNEDDDDKERKICNKYLNVNLSHELWKDITFSFLQIQHDDPPVALYLFRLFWRWQALNGIIYFAILRTLSKIKFE